MKTVVIGDIHGRTEWKKIVEKHGTEDVRYIFLGDYLDSHDGIPSDVQCRNFTEIVDFKKGNPDSVFLLIGNHDMHYYDTKYACSNFSINTYNLIHSLMKECVDSGLIEFGIADFDSNMLFTHAGISKAWLKDQFGSDVLDADMLAKMVNLDSLAFSHLGNSPYGDDEIQGPAWIRPISLIKSAVDGFTQFVGHTRFADEKAFYNSIGNNSFYFCDSMPNDYVVIDESGKIEILPVC